MKEIEQTGGRRLPLDVTEHDAVAPTVQCVLHDSARIDVLVNSAGYGIYGRSRTSLSTKRADSLG